MHIYSSLPYLFIKPRIILIVWNFKIARFEITYLNEHQDWLIINQRWLWITCKLQRYLENRRKISWASTKLLMRSHFYVYSFMCKILGNLSGKFIKKHVRKLLFVNRWFRDLYVNIIIIFPCSKNKKQWMRICSSRQHVCATIIPHCTPSHVGPINLHDCFLSC